MKNKIIMALLLLSILFSNVTFAATKQDVIAAINSTYTVGDDTYRLPQSLINKAMDYLNKKNLTSKQCDKILGLIGRAVAVAQEAGTTDITKISKEDLQKGLGILNEASSMAKMDITSEIAASAPASKSSSSNKTTNNKKNDNNSTNISNQSDSIQSGGELNIASGENNFSGDNNISGESQSGEISEESFESILHEFLGTSEKGTDEEIDETVNKHFMLAIIVAIAVLFIIILIIFLLFKSKWIKIIKYSFIVIFVILFLAILFVLGVALSRIEELKIIYKFYYMYF